MRRTARHFHVGLFTVQRWIQRAGQQELDHVDLGDRSRAPHRFVRTQRALEDVVLAVRQHLRKGSDLGEYGADAIYRELLVRGVRKPPSIRTIGRILDRRGALDPRRRLRFRAPPAGWYLPDVVSGGSELDACDVIEGLSLEGGPHLDVLTAISMHGALADAWPSLGVSAKSVVACVMQRWRTAGLPRYAQFDNDVRFQGPRQHRDAIGRVSRTCMALGVTPVFAPPREPGFQAHIESFNGQWQAKVWNRFHFESLEALLEQSGRYVSAHRRRHAARSEGAPKRRHFPAGFELDLQVHPRGTLIFLRRTDDQGQVELMGRTFQVDRHWCHRLVRSEVDLRRGCIRFFSLRRRDHTLQPLLHEIAYELPRRSFQD
jgi:hypothetical protein